MTKQERIEKQKQRLAEMKEPEAALHRQGYRYIAGVDEVGRGPLAGPVVTAAVVLPEDFAVLGVDDSKKLSEKRREELYDQILDGCLAYGIGMADHKVIDEINILQATKKAMRDAIAACDLQLRVKSGGAADARIDFVLLDAVNLDGLDKPQHAVVKGDSKVLGHKRQDDGTVCGRVSVVRFREEQRLRNGGPLRRNSRARNVPDTQDDIFEESG